MMNNAKSFDILSMSCDLHNYDSLTKLFSNLYLAKFLNTAKKSFFLYIYYTFNNKKKRDEDINLLGNISFIIYNKGKF